VGIEREHTAELVTLYAVGDYIYKKNYRSNYYKILV